MVKYAWLEKENKELFNLFNTLNLQQQKYIEYRSLGFNKAEAYSRSGYTTANPTQSACVLEKRNPFIDSLVETFKAHKELMKLNDTTQSENFYKDIVKNAPVSKELEMLKTASADEAARITFYNNIISGKMTTTIKTKTKDESGSLTISKVEVREPTFADRMAARKELDKILGLKETGNKENRTFQSNDNSRTTFNFNVIDTSSKVHAKQDFSIKDENGEDEIIEVELKEKEEQEEELETVKAWNE